MPEYFEFDVSLRGVKPRIWRRFLLPVQGSTFQHLHQATQDACGWWNYHAFSFRRTARSYNDAIAGIPNEEELDMFGSTAPDARRARLAAFFSEKGATCIYEYDFGDRWIHEVKLRGVVEMPETFQRRLVGGERAFPHEDSGGLGGYERCVEFVRTGVDSLEDDPAGLREWLGGWEPDHFDLEETKAEFDRDAPARKGGPKVPRARDAGAPKNPRPTSRGKRRKPKA